MELIKVKISDIHPYEKNPRKNDAAVKELATSIQECGYCNPIIVDENMVILAGHTRLKALKKLGWKECDVIVREGLTEEQKKKYRIFDNRTGEFAEWDIDLLIEEMEGLDFSAFDINWNLPIETEQFGSTEFVNQEYGDDAFSDEKFDYVCPCCGFRFNKKKK